MFKIPSPCEYTHKCDSYFQGSYTCASDKNNCPIHEQFENKEITEFKVQNINGC